MSVETPGSYRDDEAESATACLFLDALAARDRGGVPPAWKLASRLASTPTLAPFVPSLTEMPRALQRLFSSCFGFAVKYERLFGADGVIVANVLAEVC